MTRHCIAIVVGFLSGITSNAQPADVIDRVAPSVVLIETTGGSERVGKGDRLVRRGTGPTTGVVVASEGYVITSAFNFANKPTAITVSVPGRRERFLGKVVATDHSRLLTLLKINATGLPVPAAVPATEVQIGQTAIALGRTLDPNPDHSPSVSVGIVSATHRIWGRCLQTDAKISPVNYGGPLVAGDGRVLGILVPASPAGDGDTAGFEWYDSGIGFAVPFDHVLNVLPRLREGKDLRRGLLGIRPKGGDQYSVAPAVSLVSPESPAAKAGIKPGDIVVAIDGQPVVNHAQMMHRLGPKYDGDTVSITVKRGDEELSFSDLKLVGGEPPYRHPFIGIVPVRDDPELGVAIRAVWPDSPAAAARLQPGDRIMKIKPPGAATALPFSGRDQLLEVLEAIPAGSEVQLDVKKGDKTETVTLKLGPLPEAVLPQIAGVATAKRALAPRKQPPVERPPGLPGLPSMRGQPKEKDKVAPKKAEPKVEEKKEEPKKVETGLMTRPSPSRDREYWVYVPPNYDPNVSHALVVWLHAAGQGGKDAKDVVEIWKAACEQQHLILVGPKSNNDAGWLASEAEQVQEVAREVLGQYTIDRQRVIAHGLGAGGQMAFYLAFNARDLIRAAAVSGAALASPPRDNVAGQRLSFFVVAGGKDPAAKDIAAAKPALNEKRFPVVFREVADMGKEYLDRTTFDELVRWIDSLDRL